MHSPPGRIVSLDAAKGLGILLVVLGHNDLALVSPFLQRFIYSFHVPLFFCLSGYFLEVDRPFRAFLVRRFRSALQPYLVALLLVYLVALSFSGMSFSTALGRFAKAMYATGPYIDWAPLWFLPSLFVTGLLAYLLRRYLLDRVGSRPARWALLLGLAALGTLPVGAFYPFSLTVLGRTYTLFGLPYSLDLVLLTGFFYLLGGEIRRALPEGILDRPWFPLVAGAALAAAALAVPDTIDLHARQYPRPLVSTLAAVLGILFTLSAARHVAARFKRLSAALAYTGGASLYILIFHLPIQEYWNARLLAAGGSQLLATVAAFLVSVGLSLAFYGVFVELNPVAARIFGRKPPATGQTDSARAASRRPDQPSQ